MSYLELLDGVESTVVGGHLGVAWSAEWADM